MNQAQEVRDRLEGDGVGRELVKVLDAYIPRVERVIA